MKRNILYMLLIFGLLSACLPTVADTGEEGSVTEDTDTIQAKSTPLPPFTEESISPGNMQAYSFWSSSGQELEYLLYLPDEYYERLAWPLIMSLHGDKGRRNRVDDRLPSRDSAVRIHSVHLTPVHQR